MRGPRAQRAGGLVEGDVAIGANPQHLQIDAATFLDPPFVPGAEGLVVVGRARGHVDILPRHVDLLEEVLVHEVVVALEMILRQAHVLVEIEGGYLGEVEPLVLVHADQLFVEAQRRGSGRQPQHGVGLGIEHLGHELGGDFADDVIGRFNDDLHGRT